MIIAPNFSSILIVFHWFCTRWYRFTFVTQCRCRWRGN